MKNDNQYMYYIGDQKKRLEFYELKYKNLEKNWWKLESEKKKFAEWLKEKEWRESRKRFDKKNKL